MCASSVKLSSDWCGHDREAWPPKGGKTVWILDKQPYQRERVSQPSDGKALCLVGAQWELMEQGASCHECCLVHLALCSCPGRFMMGLPMDALCGGPRIRCRGTPSLCSACDACCMGRFRSVTWLILPVVICLSQRLSHACLSVNNSYETANGSLNQLSNT